MPIAVLLGVPYLQQADVGFCVNEIRTIELRLNERRGRMMGRCSAQAGRRSGNRIKRNAQLCSLSIAELDSCAELFKSGMLEGNSGFFHNRFLLRFQNQKCV